MTRLTESDRNNMQKLIRLILDTPLSSKEPIVEVDGEKTLDEFKKANVDVKTRILLQAAMDAMKGDRQWAEFLMKYGGLEPMKEQHVVMETPTIVDDMGSGAKVEAAEQFIPTQVYDDPDETGGN